MRFIQFHSHTVRTWLETPVGDGRGGVPGRSLIRARMAAAAMALAVAVALALAPVTAIAAVGGLAAAPAWSIVPSPNVQFGQGSLGSVSCSSRHACTAVGGGLVERWNGATWQMQHLAGQGQVGAVSCPAADSCMAVGAAGGQALAEQWDGTRWTVTLSGESLELGSGLSAVSCPAPADCTAVGEETVPGDSGESTMPVPLAFHWDGSTWSLESAPFPAGWQSASLTGVSCPADNFCVATGSNNFQSFAGRWNGTTWSAHVFGGQLSLLAVSCASATTCTAAGDGQVTSHPAPNQPLSQNWQRGHGWTLERAPIPKDGVSGSLAGVSCPSAGSCFATGSYLVGPRGRTQRTLADHWNGTKWALHTALEPAGTQYSSLPGVSCPAPQACTAVGWATPRSIIQIRQTLGENWNGTQWATTRTRDVAAAADTALSGVSCPAAAWCAAVGSAGGTPAALVWNGTAWTVAPVPVTGGALSGVSCLSAADCTAVGHDLRGALAEHWNGTAWTVAHAQQPAGAQSSVLSAVSCRTASACLAVGQYTTSTGLVTALAEHWNGTAWTILNLPRLPGRVLLNGVSCVAATSCLAVGSDGAKTLAERWSGGTWTVLPASDPTGALASFLTAVSCTSATACTAVGAYRTAPGDLLAGTLAERWDGTTWTIQPTPATTGITEPLAAVSCPAATACTATGSYAPPHGGDLLTLAEAWDGTAWTVQPTPNPSPAGTGTLAAVTCQSTTACVAAGRSLVSSLVETYSTAAGGGTR